MTFLQNLRANKRSRNKPHVERSAIASGGAIATIRDGVSALIREVRQPGRLRMMPVYERTDVEWIDPHGQHHRRIESDWIGLAWYRNGQLVREIRWGRRGTGGGIGHDNDRNLLR